MGKKLFDFVIGNPPYQNDLTGDSKTATPVYHIFMDAAYSVSEKTMLITPARFLFNAGYTPKSWNQERLNDEHFKVVSYFQDANSVFNGVDIKGGVAITYHDSNQKFEAIRVFVQYDEVDKILHKVLRHKSFESIQRIIVSSFAYHYTSIMYEENPSLMNRASKGHDYDIQSNAFITYPEVFLDDKKAHDDYVRVLGRSGSVRCWKYIKRKYIANVSNLDKYKIFLAKATGTGQFGEVLPESIIGSPGDGATVTFLSIGDFMSLYEGENCIKYVKTKFARMLLGVLKVTQDNTPGKWKYVPLQDFTTNADIDWSKSVHEIDLQLYRKYGLDEDEISFIETHVKEMA